MASYVQVSNLDFQDIKTALKEYLRAQSDFTSYDFCLLYTSDAADE